MDICTSQRCRPLCKGKKVIMLKNGMLLETRVSYNNVSIFPPKVLCPRSYDVPFCAVLLRIYNRTWYKISMYKRDGLKPSDEGEKGNRPYWKWTVTLDINTYPRVPLRLYTSRFVIVLLRILQDEKKTPVRELEVRENVGEKNGNRVYHKWIVTLDISIFLSPAFYPTLYFSTLFIVLRRIFFRIKYIKYLFISRNAKSER